MGDIEDHPLLSKFEECILDLKYLLGGEGGLKQTHIIPHHQKAHAEKIVMCVYELNVLPEIQNR